MAEQLVKTYARVGVEGRTGLNIYAISPGVDVRSAKSDALLDVASKRNLPSDSDMGPWVRPDDVPISLAFLVDGDRRALAHRIYLGADIYGRWGNYLSHVLFDLPPSFTARDAIRLWGSPFWLRDIRETPPGVTLASLDPRSLPPGPLADHRFDASLAFPIRYLIAAHLSHPEARVVVVGLPDLAAELIAALCAALPAPMLENLAFSTYEAMPDDAKVRVVGACGAPLVDGEPSADYRLPRAFDRDIVVDSIEATLSPQSLDPEAEAYADFAAAALTDDQRRPELDAFVALAEVLDLRDRSALADEYRRFIDADIPGSLSSLAIKQILTTNRAPAYLARPGFRRAVVVAVSTPSWVMDGPAMVAGLRRQSQGDPRLAASLRQLADDAAAMVTENLALDNLGVAERTVEQVIRPIRGELDTFATLVPLLLPVARGETPMSAQAGRFALELAIASGVPPSDPGVVALIGDSPRAWLELLGEHTLPRAWSSPIVEMILQSSAAVDDETIRRLIDRYPRPLEEAVERLVRADARIPVLRLLDVAVERGDSSVVRGLLVKVVMNGSDDLASDVTNRVERYATDSDRHDATVDLVSALELHAFSQLLARTPFHPLVARYLDELARLLARPDAFAHLSKIQAIAQDRGLPPPLADKAAILAEAATLRTRRFSETAEIAEKVARWVDRWPEGTRALRDGLDAILAPSMRTADNFAPAVECLARASGEPLELVVPRLLAATLRGTPGKLQPWVQAGVEKLVWLDAQNRSARLGEPDDWETFQRWIEQARWDSGIIPLLQTFTGALGADDAIASVDLHQVLFSTYRRYLGELNSGTPLIDEMLRSVQVLWRTPPTDPRDLGALTDLGCRTARYVSYNVFVEKTLSLRDAYRCLAPPLPEGRTALLPHLLQILTERRVRPDNCRQPAEEIVDLIAELPPSKRGQLLANDEDRVQQAVFQALKLFGDEDALARCAELVGESGNPPVAEALVIALYARIRGRQRVSESFARRVVGRVRDTPEDARQTALNRPSSAAILHAMICEPYLVEDGIELFRSLGDATPEVLAAALRTYLRKLNDYPELGNDQTGASHEAIERLKMEFRDDPDQGSNIEALLNQIAKKRVLRSPL